MSQPPSSQSLDNPRIFVDRYGFPLSIFIESNGIIDNRPKLIRTLRSHGANICADVSLARIILVEPHSSQGRQFVRDWGMDPDKVILEVAWVRHCLEAGRALLENDAWGGCGNLDGTPLDDEVVDDEDQGLFTERKAFGLNEKQPFPSPSALPRTPNGKSSTDGRKTSVLPTPRPTPAERIASSSNALVTQNNGSSSSQVLPTPPSTSTPGQVPPQQPSQPQQFLPSMPLNIPQNGPPPNMAPAFGQLVPQGYFPWNELNQQMMQAFLMNNPEAHQIMLNMMMMQGMAGNAPFMASGWSGHPGQGFIPAGFPMMQPPQPPGPMPPPNINGQYANAPVDIYGPSPPVKVEQRSPRRSMSPLPTFTTVSDGDSDSDSPPPNQSILLQRGKKRHRNSLGPTSPKPAKRSKSPATLRKEKREKKHAALLIENTIIQQDAVKRDPTPPIGIFTSKSGEPMNFYIQVQLRNRQNFIKQVKKNGGKIIADLSNADYIILDTRPSKDRDQWLKVVRDLRRFALRPGFIEACINTIGIVEERDFKIEPLNKPRSSSSPRRKRREDSVESEEKSTSPASQSSQGRTTISRSPTPPSGSLYTSSTTRTPFTPEEMTYAFKFAKYICHKNPTIAISQIGIELARRAPRHPAGSWMSVFYKDNRSKLDRIRQEAQNETRNGSSTAVASGSEPEVEAQLIQPVGPDASPTLDKPGAAQPNGVNNINIVPERSFDADQSRLHDTDIRTIVEFFANPPEGVFDDDALWAAIIERHPCHTASSWQDFYAANQEVVNQRLREALDMSTEGTAVATA